jgi:hypothetical protein
MQGEGGAQTLLLLTSHTAEIRGAAAHIYTEEYSKTVVIFEFFGVGTW